jgi:hypothetical protein
MVERVGWVERSETHRISECRWWVSPGCSGAQPTLQSGGFKIGFDGGGQGRVRQDGAERVEAVPVDPGALFVAA